jgi:hypothetical protein
MQSEIILSEKRRVYESFLAACPVPNDAYNEVTDEVHVQRTHRVQEAFGPIMLYASVDVTVAISIYLEEFEKVGQILTPESEALHPEFKRLAKAHNDVILEMRRDGLAWSVFAHRGTTRLPKDRLEKAKKNSLE